MRFWSFWSFLIISDQFLINFWPISDQNLINFCIFCRILQKFADSAWFCTFWLISASLCRARGHGLGRPLPQEAAPLRNTRNINDFSMFREGQGGSVGLGPLAAPAGRWWYLVQNMPISAEIWRNLQKFVRNWSEIDQKLIRNRSEIDQKWPKWPKWSN